MNIKNELLIAIVVVILLIIAVYNGWLGPIFYTRQVPMVNVQYTNPPTQTIETTVVNQPTTSSTSVYETTTTTSTSTSDSGTVIYP